MPSFSSCRECTSVVIKVLLSLMKNSEWLWGRDSHEARDIDRLLPFWVERPFPCECGRRWLPSFSKEKFFCWNRGRTTEVSFSVFLWFDLLISCLLSLNCLLSSWTLPHSWAHETFFLSQLFFPHCCCNESVKVLLSRPKDGKSRFLSVRLFYSLGSVIFFAFAWTRKGIYCDSVTGFLSLHYTLA